MAALNVIFGVNRIKFSTDYKLYGWLTIANGGLTLLTAARMNLISFILAVPSSILLKYHRAFGRLTLIHATLHAALTIEHYVKVGGITALLANGYVQAGMTAWVSLILLFITSIPIIRRRYFEAFYYPHFLFLAFVIGALIHAVLAKEFLLPGLGLWGLDILIRVFYNFRRVKVVSAEGFGNSVVKFRLHGVQARRPGQIAWIQVPSISMSWHPFTLASSKKDGEATIAVRGLGGFTRKLQSATFGSGPTTLSSASSGLNEGADRAMEMSVMETGQAKMAHDVLRVAGPYGLGSLEWDQYPVVCIVAGGIGITPGISIASYIIQRAASNREDSTKNHWTIYIIWIVKDIRHLRWFEEELIQLSGLAGHPDNRATLNVDIHVSTSTTKSLEPAAGSQATGNSYSYEGPGAVYQGRPNLMAWFEGIRLKNDRLDAAVSICGPKPLIRDAIRAAASASGVSGLFHVEEEVFER